MANDPTPTDLDPPIPEDGLSYVQRELRRLRQSGRTTKQISRRLGEMLIHMENAVEYRVLRPVVTEVGVADYVDTDECLAFIATDRLIRSAVKRAKQERRRSKIK